MSKKKFDYVSGRVPQEDKVSVIILGESSEIDHIRKLIRTTKEQTYKNLDIIVVTNVGHDIGGLKQEYSTDHSVRFFTATAGFEAAKEGKENAIGEYICYRTINNVFWFERHVECHMEEFYKNKGETLWSISMIEYRDLALINEPFNTLGWRIDPSPEVERICLDEIIFHKSIEPNWDYTIIEKGEMKQFVPGRLIQDWNTQHRGCCPDEISVICWMKTETEEQTQDGQQVRDAVQSESITVPSRTQLLETCMTDDNDEIYIDRDFPEIFGNIQLDSEYNNPIRDQIYKTKRVHHIAVRRDLGMGDIIVTQPVVAKLKAAFPDAKISYVTSDRLDCRLVAKLIDKCDEVIAVPGLSIFRSYLSDIKYTNVRVDFNLAYESRAGLNVSYLDSYAQTAGLKIHPQERRPKLNYNINGNVDRIHKNDYIILGTEGSGWNHREVPKDFWVRAFSGVDLRNTEIIEPAFRPEYYCGIGSKDYVGCSFADLANLIYFSSGYVGIDSGMMHFAHAFKKPMMVVWGCTSPEMVLPCWDSPEVMNVKIEPQLPCQFCKHNFFYGVEGDQRTFVPSCSLEGKDKFKCIRGIHPNYIAENLKIFLEKNGIT